jgi:hypothetical protein
LDLKEKNNRRWRRLHNEKLHKLYSSSNIIREMKSRMMRWAGHEAYSGGDGKLIPEFSLET